MAKSGVTLRSAFRQEGAIVAGNACGVDSVEPGVFGLGSVPTGRQALARAAGRYATSTALKPMEIDEEST